MKSFIAMVITLTLLFPSPGLSKPCGASRALRAGEVATCDGDLVARSRLVKARQAFAALRSCREGAAAGVRLARDVGETHRRERAAWSAELRALRAVTLPQAPAWYRQPATIAAAAGLAFGLGVALGVWVDVSRR